MAALHLGSWQILLRPIAFFGRAFHTLCKCLKQGTVALASTIKYAMTIRTPGNQQLSQFKPASQLVVKSSEVWIPGSPAIDAHNHLGADFGGGWHAKPVAQLLARLDEAHITHYVDLDGGWGEDIFDARLRKFKQAAPDRFLVFGGPNWHLWSQSGNNFGDIAAQRFRAQVARGASGLKIWKDFGLHVRDHAGLRVTVDDPRLDPLWHAAAECRVPVLVHVADPVAFFDPMDATNERWDELQAHPDWHFPAPAFPPFMDIINAFARLVKRWPTVTFIGAHVACYAENLSWVSQLLDDCPNLFIDFSARISELGRQPYSSRRFFERYQDRILFGIDAGPDLDTYRTYYRFLETDDEYFAYGTGAVPQQGRWQIYGLNLPKPLLTKIYSTNARRIFGIT
jgi:predicted TIM-barrel fold metal-dependent hydrolase